MILKYFLPFFLLLLPLQAVTLQNEILDSKPWGYYNSEGAIKGVLADFAKELGEDAGFRVENRLAPYARIWRNIENGKGDITFLIRSEEKRKSVEYIAKLTNFKTVVVARDGIVLEKYEDLKNLRVGVLNGSKMNKKFDEDKSIQKKYFRSYQIMLKMLKEKRVDAIIGLSTSIYFLANELGFSDYLGKKIVLENKEIWLHLSKMNANKIIVDKLKRSMKRLEKREVLDKLLQKYIGNRWREIN